MRATNPAAIKKTDAPTITEIVLVRSAEVSELSRRGTD